MHTSLLASLGASASLLLALPASAATYDLTGLWDYSTSNEALVGPCVTNGDRSGQAVLNQDGDLFALHLISGSVCDPAAGCHFHGGITDNHYVGSNSYSDGAGGQVANGLDLVASSADALAGTGSSTWRGDGAECVWTYDVIMTRAAIPDGGIAYPDATPPWPEDAGPGTDANVATDAVHAPDASSTFDAASSHDGGPTPDSAVLGDAASQPDLGAAIDSSSTSDDAGALADASPARRDSGPGPDDKDDGDCGCRTSAVPGVGVMALGGMALAWRRRRQAGR